MIEVVEERRERLGIDGYLQELLEQLSNQHHSLNLIDEDKIDMKKLI